MKKFLFILAITLGLCINFSSCITEEVNEEEKSEETTTGLVKLSLNPELEVNTTTRLLDNNSVYVVLIQKKIADGSMVDYCWGMFSNPYNIFVYVDKGIYSIKVTSLDKSQVNLNRVTDCFRFTNNKFDDLDEYILRYLNYGVKFGNNFYGEMNDVLITKFSNISIRLKYVTFGIKLEGINLQESDKLNITFRNNDELVRIYADSKNPVSEIIKCKMPNKLSDYTTKDESILEDVIIGLNGNRITNKIVNIPVERKKITIIKVDCKRINITKESAILADGKTIYF